MTQPANGCGAAWTDVARDLLTNRPLVLIGVKSAVIRDMIHLGGNVLGSIELVTAGVRPRKSDAAYPVLTLKATARDPFDVASCLVASVLESESDRVAEFIEKVDPRAEATVVSFNPSPPDISGGRSAWGQDADCARMLEDKRATSEILRGVIPFIRSEIAAWPITGRSWNEACRRLGNSRLVLQKLGLNVSGSQTYVCDSFEQTKRCFRDQSLLEVKLSPFVEGMPVNVSGIVIDSDRTIVFPPSRQIVQIDDCGRPLYAGNEFGDFWSDEEYGAIVDEARALGRRLSERGFLGPFGADFIREAGGARYYHDINARLNGAHINVGLYLAEGSIQPISILMLARYDWSTDEIREIEARVRFLSRQHPMTRYFLHGHASEKAIIERGPPEGVWKIPPDASMMQHIRDEEGFESLSDDEAIFRNRLIPGTELEVGDRLVLGDLLMGRSLALRLEKSYGADTSHTLLKTLFNSAKMEPRGRSPINSDPAKSSASIVT